MRAQSIRRSLLIRCGIGVGVLLCLLSCAVYLLVRQSLYRELDDSLKETASLLGNQVELENGGIVHEWREGMGANHPLIANGLYQFWDETSGGTVRSPALHDRDLPKYSGLDGKPLLRNILLPEGGRGRAVGLRIYPFVLPEEVEHMKERHAIIDPKTLPHLLVVARDAEPIHRTLERLKLMLMAGTACTLGLGYLLIDRVVLISLRPLDRLTREVRGRAEHQLDAALDVPGELPVELTGLARDFDSLLGRVAVTRQRERDFIRHAAHELRTPIAGLRATTDLALSQTRDAEAYRNHLAVCQKTAIELGELVQRLSMLARIGQTPQTAKQEPVDVAGLLLDCEASFLRRSQDRGLSIDHRFPEEKVMASADSALLKIVFNNLLDNAVCYAAAGSAVWIAIRRIDERVELVFGNAAEDLPDPVERLFEPLFRGESSRHDAESHLGVGLTLSLDVVKAMNGTLQARRAGEGAIEMVLELPVAG